MLESVFWLIFLGCMGIFSLVIVLRLELWQGAHVEGRYRAKSGIYDSVERLFLGHLVWAVGRQAIILGKVRLADVITLDFSGSLHRHRKAYDQIARQHLDFVICDKRSTRVLCVVELYDPAAHPKRALLNARFLDRILKEAGIPIARFPRARKYRTMEIESSIRQTLAKAGLTWSGQTSDQRGSTSARTVP